LDAVPAIHCSLLSGFSASIALHWDFDSFDHILVGLPQFVNINVAWRNLRTWDGGFRMVLIKHIASRW
jgi:hypothetical protein